MCPLLIGFFGMCGPSCAHVFCEFLYAKGMLSAKTCGCKNIFIIIIFFYATTVWSTWGLKESKSRKYFYDLFNACIGK
jgi:hypothetical protein